MGLKARLRSYCTKRANNGVNLVTSRKINTRLARPIALNMLICNIDNPYKVLKVTYISVSFNIL